jgi:hypothetical protein
MRLLTSPLHASPRATTTQLARRETQRAGSYLPSPQPRHRAVFRPEVLVGGRCHSDVHFEFRYLLSPVEIDGIDRPLARALISPAEMGDANARGHQDWGA